MTEILALVGAAGGAGTTRLAVEFGATLARSGRDVAVVDTALATQGLASYLPGTIDPDVTALLTGDAELGAVLRDHPADLPGRLALAPARAPFERLARAQTAGAAKRLESQLAAASLSHDVVLVDVPPVNGNHAIAAVNAADRIAVVTPDTPRGGDGLARMQDRLDDIGADVDAVIANRERGFLSTAPTTVPESETANPADCPACLTDDEFGAAVADGVEELLGVDLGLEFDTDRRIGGILG